MSAFVGTQPDEDIKCGAFLPASEKEDLEEEREFLAGPELPDCYFRALHRFCYIGKKCLKSIR